MASDASMRLVARRALFTGLALALVLLLLLDQTAATEANGRRRPGNASNRKNIKRPGNNNNNNANNNGQNNGQNNAPSAPARRPDRFLVALKPFETDFLDRAQVRMLRRDLLTMSAWKTEELTKSQAVIYRAKPLKVMGAARGRQPAIIIKDAVFDNDPEVAAKQFGMLKYEIEVMDDVNGLPFMVRYLGSQITGPTANKGPDVKIFLNLAHEGSLESVMEKRYKGALDLDSVNSRMIVGEMIVALAMLHSKGYLHRDIKMEQFLVGADGHIRLTDFGLAIKNDPKVIWDDILSNLGSVAFTPQNAPELKGKVYNYKERLLIPGKMHLQLDNPSYRAPELQEARRISTLQNDAVISIFERLLAEKRAEKKVAYDAAVAANAEKLPSKKLTPNEIATIRNRVKGEFAQEMPGWRQQIMRENPGAVYGKPIDSFALGMTIYDLFTGYAAVKAKYGPFPHVKGMSRYEPDYTKPMDFNFFRTYMHMLGTSDQSIDECVELLTKMLEPDPVKRVSGAMTLLQLPFFKRMKITFGDLVRGGIEASKFDNKENSGITEAATQPRPRLNFGRPSTNDFVGDLVDVLASEANQDPLDNDMNPDAKGPVALLLDEIEAEPLVPPTRDFGNKVPQKFIDIRDRLVQQNIKSGGGDGDGGEDGEWDAEGDDEGGGSAPDDGLAGPEKIKGPTRDTGKSQQSGGRGNWE